MTVLAQIIGLWLGNDISELNIPPYGCFELIRSSIECAAHALWVVAPEDSVKRLERRLYSQSIEIENVERFLKASESENLKQVDDRKAKLETFSRRISVDFTPRKKLKDGREGSKLGRLAPSKPSVTRFY